MFLHLLKFEIICIKVGQKATNKTMSFSKLKFLCAERNLYFISQVVNVDHNLPNGNYRDKTQPLLIIYMVPLYEGVLSL